MDPLIASALITSAAGIGSSLLAPRPASGGGGAVYDYASLYASLLSPGNTLLTTAATDLAQRSAAVQGTESIQSKALGQAGYDTFTNASNKENTLAGLQAGLASQYASSAAGLGDLRGKGEIATEMMGPEVAKNLTEQYAQSVGQLANQGLVGQTNLLLPAAQAYATIATEASRASNKLASDVATTNLDIKKQQESTRNQLALQRGNIEGQLALKRFGAGMALAGHAAFA